MICVVSYSQGDESGKPVNEVTGSTIWSQYRAVTTLHHHHAMILSVMRAFINWIHFQQSHYMFKGQRVNDNPLNYTVKNKKGASVIVMVDVKKKTAAWGHCSFNSNQKPSQPIPWMTITVLISPQTILVWLTEKLCHCWLIFHCRLKCGFITPHADPLMPTTTEINTCITFN